MGGEYPAAHRGHRPRALDQPSGRGDPRRHALARARLGGRGGAPVRARGAPPRRSPRHAGKRRRLSLLCAQDELDENAREAARRRHCRRATTDAGATAIRPRRLPASRRRSGCAPGRTARRSSRTRCREGRVRQQGSRRSRPAALRRQPDLYARRRRRRSRHGRHPYHPRRRSSDQRGAADADLSGARLGRRRRWRISR